MSEDARTELRLKASKDRALPAMLQAAFARGSGPPGRFEMGDANPPPRCDLERPAAPRRAFFCKPATGFRSTQFLSSEEIELTEIGNSNLIIDSSNWRITQFVSSAHFESTLTTSESSIFHVTVRFGSSQHHLFSDRRL